MKEETSKKKNSLGARITRIAESGSGKGCGMEKWFTLPQYKEMRALHIDICKKLVELSKKYNNYPLTYLVYFAVSKNAHRINVFAHGYEEIHEKKAEKILSWLQIFAKYHKNDKLFKNANVAHALCRFYDKFSTKTKDFKAAMERMESDPKVNTKNAKFLVEGMGIGKNAKTEEEMAAAEAVSAN